MPIAIGHGEDPDVEDEQHEQRTVIATESGLGG